MRHRFVFVVQVGLVQAVVTVALTLVTFGSSMSSFEAGEPPSAGAATAGFLLDVLSWPLLPVVAALPPGPLPNGFPWEYLLFLANGLCWGLGALGMLAAWRSIRSRSGSR